MTCREQEHRIDGIQVPIMEQELKLKHRKTETSFLKLVFIFHLYFWHLSEYQ